VLFARKQSKMGKKHDVAFFPFPGDGVPPSAVEKTAIFSTFWSTMPEVPSARKIVTRPFSPPFVCEPSAFLPEERKDYQLFFRVSTESIFFFPTWGLPLSVEWEAPCGRPPLFSCDGELYSQSPLDESRRLVRMKCSDFSRL